MKVKLPKDPLVLSDEAYSSLEALLEKNEKRKNLNAKERELLEGSRVFDGCLTILENI